MNKKLHPLVSVNIRTFNSAKTLMQTLQSVKDQSYKNIEILISDGRSSDDSVKIAKNFGARIGYADKLGDARHQNFVNSRGEYVFSVDSDQRLDKNLIKTCVEKCQKKKVNALIIAEKSILTKGTFLERVIAYDKWLIDRNRDIDVTFGTACPRFFEKSLLVDVPWPKKLSIFDDTLLYDQLLKKGAKVDYVSDQFIKHTEVTSWVTLAKKFYRYGKGYTLAFKQNPTTIAAHSLPRRSYFTTAIFLKPHYFIGLLMLYSVKVGAASLGAASYFISTATSEKK